MITEGLIITIVGMSTVFVFLTILVFAMDIMSKIVIWINKFMPEEVKTAEPVRRNSNVEEEIAVAIAVAKMS